jgi:hypothetical protein
MVKHERAVFEFIKFLWNEGTTPLGRLLQPDTLLNSSGSVHSCTYTPSSVGDQALFSECREHSEKTLLSVYMLYITTLIFVHMSRSGDVDMLVEALKDRTHMTVEERGLCVALLIFYCVACLYSDTSMHELCEHIIDEYYYVRPHGPFMLREFAEDQLRVQAVFYGATRGITAEHKQKKHDARFVYADMASGVVLRVLRGTMTVEEAVLAASVEECFVTPTSTEDNDSGLVHFVCDNFSSYIMPSQRDKLLLLICEKK